MSDKENKYKGICKICKKSLFENDNPIMVKSKGSTRYYCLKCYKEYWGGEKQRSSEITNKMQLA